MKAKGDKLLIMTNRHVAASDAGDPEEPKSELSVVFRSGTPQEQEGPATSFAYDSKKVGDLAVLEVRGVRQPRRRSRRTRRRWSRSSSRRCPPMRRDSHGAG